MNNNQEVDLNTLKQIVETTRKYLDGCYTKEEHSDLVVLILVNSKDVG